MSNAKFSTPINNDEDSDDDDVDIYVSPKHFVGRTPGRKATRQKIFDEQSSSREASLRSNPFAPSPVASDVNSPQSRQHQPIHLKSVKYTIGSEQQDDPTNPSARRVKILSYFCIAVNYTLVILSIYILSISIWALFAQHEYGLTAYMSIQGVGLRSPVAFGLCLMLAAIMGLINGLVLGVSKVAPSIVVEDENVDERRKSFVAHQLMSIVTIFLFALVLMSSIPPLSNVVSSGVTATTWRDMATKYPQSVCLFQVSKKCAGPTDYLCMSSDPAVTSVSCPGHHCADGCTVESRRRPVVHMVACKNCASLFSSPLLARCKASEGYRATSRNCRDPLKRIVRRFYLIVLISACIVLFFAILVMVVSIVCPLLST